MSLAKVLKPAKRQYRGALTRPERWSTWTPRQGDILVCTPPKCGTTWTQTMLTMLVYRGRTLPAPVPVMSPWVDVDLGIPEQDVADALEQQSGRRVVKTHTPADGFPIWDGVTVIGVYRHPLDVFFSLRKHAANVSDRDENEPMLRPLDEAFSHFIEEDADISDFDQDKLATITLHYGKTALSDRLPNLKLFHYADFLAQGRIAVQQLAKASQIDVDDTVIDLVANASSFSAMRANAKEFAPAGGTGFWKNDSNFFDSASSRKWEGVLSERQIQAYKDRFRTLVPDAAARAWLETGNASGSRPGG